MCFGQEVEAYLIFFDNGPLKSFDGVTGVAMGQKILATVKCQKSCFSGRSKNSKKSDNGPNDTFLKINEHFYFSGVTSARGNGHSWN